MVEIQHDGERFTLDGEALANGETLYLRGRVTRTWIAGLVCGEPRPDDPESAADGGISHVLLLLDGFDAPIVRLEAGVVARRPARQAREVAHG